MLSESIATPPQPILSEPGSDSFRQDTIDVVTRLRSAVLHAIGYETHGVQKSRDIQNRFGVSLNLSWQIYRMANSADALEFCPQIPTPAPMRNLLASLKKHGTNPADILAIDQAYQAFVQHVERHAGDRTRFDLMVAQVAGSKAGSQVEFAHRRSVFDAFRYFTGVEMETFLISDLLHPSLTVPGQVDQGFVRMRNNLRRLNSQTTLKIDGRAYLKPSDGIKLAVEPLDAVAFERYHIPILPAFCSTAELPLRQYEAPAGNFVTEWLGETVGKLGAVDVAFGEVRRDVPLAEVEKNQTGCTTAVVFTMPVRTLIRDMLVHRASFGPALGELSLLESATVPTDAGSIDANNLPKMRCNEHITFMGGGESAAYTPEVPKYVSMLRYTCQTLGWQLEDFDIYRVRIEYPLIHSLLRASYTFPNRPYSPGR